MSTLRSGAGLLVVDQARRVTRLDVSSKSREDGSVLCRPFRVHLVFLVLFDHSVGVELGGFHHLLNVRYRFGLYADPAEGRNALCHRRKVIKELGGPISVLHVRDFGDGPTRLAYPVLQSGRVWFRAGKGTQQEGTLRRKGLQDRFRLNGNSSAPVYIHMNE